MQNNSINRFSNRVDDYVKYRPKYPSDVLKVLKEQFYLKTSDTIVDVGSGTGISAELFLENGNTVYAVEPNEQMRTTAESLLAKYSNFRSVNGTSENTTLPAAFADFIVVAQAFHWFSPMPTQKEFLRILKDNGWVVIIFNDRKTSGSDFAVQYEELLNEFGSDYKEVKHRNVTEKRLTEFLGNYKDFYFPNHQEFDFAGLMGRLKSSSYAPKEGDPRFLEMTDRLNRIFEENQKDGRVVMEYTTQIFCSQLKQQFLGNN